MISEINSFLRLVKTMLIAFMEFDFSQINYESLGLALGAGLLLLTLFFYKLLWGRNKFQHLYSGHVIPIECDESNSATRRLIVVLPKIVLVFSLLFLIISISGPYLSQAKIESVVESRERVELIDNSSSMGWPFGNTGKSSCEVVREKHIEFLELRRGQNDRVSLWSFSNNAYKIENFIIDDNLYKRKVAHAPCVMVNSGHPSLPENDSHDQIIDIVAPRALVMIMPGEAGSYLTVGLQAVIQYFDEEGKNNIIRKSLLIVTDAAVEEDPEKEFQELKKRNIVPYIIYVKPNEVGERQFNRPNPLIIAESLKQKIRQYGGKVFDVEDRRSAELAYAEINKLETSPESIIRHLFRVLIFQYPLLIAVILGMIAMPLGIFASYFEPHP